MGRVSVVDGLAVIHLGHAADSPGTQPGVLVAIPPAVDCSLNKTSLASQRRVQLCQCPTDGVALRLILETVAPVLILGAARTWVHAVLGLELGRQLVGVDRLDIAADRVLHLDAIPRVLKGYPLHAISILANHQGSCGGNRARSGIGVNAAGGRARRRVELGAILSAR